MVERDRVVKMHNPVNPAGNDRGTRCVLAAVQPSLSALMMLRTLLLALVAAALVLTGCRKDTQFTEDRVELIFSQDTILYDTIFTTVGSITKRFTARNPNSNAVKVDIALAGGSPSPYRINVDGASGTSFSDVEILGGDSIYVFVEATLDANNANNPFIIEDKIHFNTNGAEQNVLLLAWGQDAHFHYPDQFIQGFPAFSYIVGGFDGGGNQICGEVEVWTNDKPHVIYGYAVVDSCNKLEIQPGVKVYFHGGGGLWVYRGGWIEALGTTTDPITFQGDRLESLYENLPGQWDRIWINEGDFANEDNRFENVEIRNSLIGIQCETWPLSVNEPTTINKLVLNNVKVLNCSAAGLLSRNYRITANNLLVGDAGQYSVALTGGGEYQLNHMTVGNFWDWEVRNTPAFIVTNYFQDINGAVQVRDITSSEFRNSIIHGSNSNEFELDLDNLGNSALNFHDIMLKTDENVSGPFFTSNVYVDQNPAFADGPADDYHLTSGSYARERGLPSTPEAFLDLDGNSRCEIWPDLGCYEFCP